MNEFLFTAYLDKSTFNMIMTRFFQTVGYIEKNVELDFEEVVVEDEGISLKAGMTEATIQ